MLEELRRIARELRLTETPELVSEEELMRLVIIGIVGYPIDKVSQDLMLFLEQFDYRVRGGKIRPSSNTPLILSAIWEQDCFGVPHFYDPDNEDCELCRAQEECFKSVKRKGGPVVTKRFRASGAKKRSLDQVLEENRRKKKTKKKPVAKEPTYPDVKYRAKRVSTIHEWIASSILEMSDKLEVKQRVSRLPVTHRYLGDNDNLCTLLGSVRRLRVLTKHAPIRGGVSDLKGYRRQWESPEGRVLLFVQPPIESILETIERIALTADVPL